MATMEVKSKFKSFKRSKLGMLVMLVLVMPILAAMGAMRAAVGDATATGDTVKTTIGTLTVPKKARAITGVYCYATGAATLTSGEPVTGIFELESPDVDLAPMQLPLDVVDILTSGAVAYSPRVWPINVPVSGAEQITCYVTMDVAQTGALKARFGFIYDMG